MGDNRNNRISIRLSDSEKEALQKLALKDKRVYSDYARLVLLDHIEKEMDKMINLEGEKWGDLSESQKSELMGKARVWENVVGECTVDFEGTDLSICGFNQIAEDEDILIIDDNDILYSPKMK